jgi:hypothetical protein
LYCDGVDTCSNGICVSAGNPCSGATPVCDEANDECDACDDAADCEDYNACTTNTCSAGACSYPAVANGTSCEDGLYCTLTDTCMGGECGGAGSPCEAGYTCDELNTECDSIVGAKRVFIQN